MPQNNAGCPAFCVERENDISVAETNEPGLDRKLTPICGIGASAGGVNALRAFFRQVPDDLGLAYVVIVHLAPDHPSAMSEILSGATEMPVRQVEDSPKLEPNCVYVIAPDRELAIEGETVTSRPFTDDRGKRAPIDVFFRSIATSRGDGLAFVLTGAGSDGAVGIRAIKEAGGVVFVQDPGEAEFPSMPQSAIATGVADFVGTISSLIERLGEVAHSKHAVRSLDMGGAANDLRRIITFLHSRTGHDFSSYKRATVMRRVLRRMQVARVNSLEDYAAYLQDAPEEASELFRDLLISVTQFFRDPAAFDALAEEVVAPLLGEASEEGIRAWVVGCATGEEAYSIAILMLEEASRRQIPVPIQIFASDLDEGALQTAREGRFPRTIEADVSEERLRRFFIPEGNHYRIRQEVRETVLFTSHSVLKDPPFMRLDLVSCRNLMIYFERSLQEKLCAIFHFSLKPEGFLFLGSAETADSAPGLFGAVDRDHRIYRPRPQARPSLPLLSPQHGLEADSRPAPAAPAPRRPRNEGQLADHIDALERAAPPNVLVNETQQVVHLSQNAGRYIMHSAGSFSGRFPDIVRPELRLDLGYALDRALGKREPTTTLPVPVAFNGDTRQVTMHIAPMGDGKKDEHQALVLFMDGGPIELEEEPESLAEGRPDEVRRLHAELKAAHEALVNSRKEHEAAVQDLRAANEELQSINEEYRSTSEELETSKEELQSMNEELQTVNLELKNKLESISSAHSDLRNLTAATEIGTLFLDKDFRIRMFTPPVADLFNITENDIGRPLSDFTHRLACDDVEKQVRRVLDELSPVESEVKGVDGRWFMMRLRPYRTIEDRIEGAVISFVDISSRKAAENRLRESEQRYRTLFNSIDQGFAIIEVIFDEAQQPVDYRFLEVNDAFSRQTGLKDAVGKRMRELAPDHESHWYEIYGRIAVSRQAERFEAPADAIGHYYEVYAFPYGEPEERQVAVLFNDIQDRKQAEEQRELLTHELSHRVKNTLAVVQALANQTALGAGSVQDFRQKFIGRLQALSLAHDLLLSTQWRSADMEQLVRKCLEPYRAHGRNGVSIDGTSVELSPRQGLGLALIVHELATNAAKYGALSVPDGHLEVDWQMEPR
ncbi:MAG TPA: chemotaxis protein CheB, partial [Alphaproteobacteria bacterium]|nr:chemotaxis protein CheB [Alphaproteobacteria bacterium]